MPTVKTAVSIEVSLFEEAEVLAKELQVSRSRVFAIALEQFLQRRKGKKLLERINNVYAETGLPNDREGNARRAKHREIAKGTW